MKPYKLLILLCGRLLLKCSIIVFVCCLFGFADCVLSDHVVIDQLFFRYTVAGRSFFSPSLGTPGPLGGGTEYWRGYYQSLRPTQMGLSLNIGFTSTHYKYFSC